MSFRPLEELWRIKIVDRVSPRTILLLEFKQLFFADGGSEISNCCAHIYDSLHLVFSATVSAWQYRQDWCTRHAQSNSRGSSGPTHFSQRRDQHFQPHTDQTNHRRQKSLAHSSD